MTKAIRVVAAAACALVPNETVTGASVNTSGVFTVPEGQGGHGEALPGTELDNLPAYCDVEITLTNPPAHDHVGVGI